MQQGTSIASVSENAALVPGNMTSFLYTAGPLIVNDLTMGEIDQMVDRIEKDFLEEIDKMVDRIGKDFFIDIGVCKDAAPSDVTGANGQPVALQSSHGPNAHKFVSESILSKTI